MTLARYLEFKILPMKLKTNENILQSHGGNSNHPGKCSSDLCLSFADRNDSLVLIGVSSKIERKRPLIGKYSTTITILCFVFPISIPEMFLTR